MDIPAWQFVLNMSIITIGLLFPVEGLHKNGVPTAFKDI